MNSKNKTFFIFLSIIASVLLSSTAFAANPDDPYYFTCRPGVRNDVTRAPLPKISIILDKSGSMTRDDSVYCLRKNCTINDYDGSRWGDAVSAIYSIMEANKKNQQAYFGLSLFSSDVIRARNCAPGSEDNIQYDVYYRYEPGGGTNTSEALEKDMKNYSCHFGLETGQASATMVITDGAPNSKVDTLKAACAHRKVSPVYFIGLSSGTDVAFNNIASAAGGTGTCTGGDPCAPSTLDDLSRGEDRINQFAKGCSGSLTANNLTELTDAINSITSKMSCTFRMETNADGVVKEDPTNEYKYLLVQPKGFTEPIPYRYSTKGKSVGAANSYTFATTDRKQISLGSAVCAQIRKNTSVSYVQTNYGCRCEQSAGTTCTVPNWSQNNLCPEGTWMCNKTTHEDYCAPKANVTTNVDCNISSLKGECSFGKIACGADTRASCKQVRFPMPEICDGLDNDCDGIDDDIKISWSDSGSFTSSLDQLKSTSSDRYNSLYSYACTKQDVCSCESAPGIPGYSPAAAAVPPTTSELEQYSQIWPYNHGSCYCQVQ